MASNVNDKVKTLHNTMVFNISTEIFGDQLENVKFLFKDTPLTSHDMFKIKNIQTLFEHLMNYKTIDYGNYQKFESMIGCIHPKVCSMVQECAVKINQLKSNLDDQGPSTATQRKTEDQSQQQSTGMWDRSFWDVKSRRD
ncbi:uncharacterized protein LOC110459381 [Mizuhopecten yessoensis]|uniref:uncharacterized protein LOC110459381 n=1 Tax=Mizuhopecten yessoensis TaxID=6573 RepID=UPI000B458B1A|nr:uncharacterized protein LOC110459381 [Mizuhopecten yessoensis]